MVTWLSDIARKASLTISTEHKVRVYSLWYFVTSWVSYYDLQFQYICIFLTFIIIVGNNSSHAIIRIGPITVHAFASFIIEVVIIVIFVIFVKAISKRVSGQHVSLNCAKDLVTRIAHQRKCLRLWYNCIFNHKQLPSWNMGIRNPIWFIWGWYYMNSWISRHYKVNFYLFVVCQTMNWDLNLMTLQVFSVKFVFTSLFFGVIIIIGVIIYILLAISTCIRIMGGIMNHFTRFIIS